jgi:hypothetical protein
MHNVNKACSLREMKPIFLGVYEYYTPFVATTPVVPPPALLASFSSHTTFVERGNMPPRLRKRPRGDAALDVTHQDTVPAGAGVEKRVFQEEISRERKRAEEERSAAHRGPGSGGEYFGERQRWQPKRRLMR